MVVEKEYLKKIGEFKKSLPSGPWCKEKDYEYFEYQGFKCLVLRIDTGGHLCGYVALPHYHPLYGIFVHDSNYPDFDVHGGLTYGKYCRREDAIYPMEDGKPYFWIGFDCDHSGDLRPIEVEEYRKNRKHYRQMNHSYSERYCNFEYTKKETIKLAQQVFDTLFSDEIYTNLYTKKL